MLLKAVEHLNAPRSASQPDHIAVNETCSHVQHFEYGAQAPALRSKYVAVFRDASAKELKHCAYRTPLRLPYLMVPAASQQQQHTLGI